MIKSEDIKGIVNELIKPPEFLVDIKINKDNHIQVYIDSMEVFNIDSCRKISRAIEEKLDREKEDFHLDVSSPGLDKPFKVIEQYKKYLNRNIDIVTDEEKHTSVLLKEVNEDGILIEYTIKKKQETKSYSFNQIVKAKPSISFK